MAISEVIPIQVKHLKKGDTIVSPLGERFTVSDISNWLSADRQLPMRDVFVSWNPKTGGRTRRLCKQWEATKEVLVLMPGEQHESARTNN